MEHQNITENMQANNENRSRYESIIKQEELKDDDILFAQLDTITNKIAANSSDYLLVQNIDMVSQLEQSPDIITNNPFHKVSDDLSTVSNPFGTMDNKLPMRHETNNFLSLSFNDKLTKESSKIADLSMQSMEGGTGTTHFVKYKLQDGKHVKVWECGACSKEFTHQYTLMRHLPTHTDERKFQCNTCGKGNLRNHIFTHTNERPYKCDICDKGFNQMSNLMCHKMKAHQRAEKPKYSCQICGMSFLKRMGLRHHEQFTHGMVDPPVTQTNNSDKLNYMNAIFVDPIKTEAMRLAIESNQTPFALLRPITGIPVLVRVLPAGNKQMLVPASAEDLKKHSHISITTKGEQEKENVAKVGSTVQIKIPVVATVIQQNDTAGQMSMSVVSPGPNGELALASDQSDLMNSKTNSFVYSSSLTNTDTTPDNVVDIEDIPLSSAFDASEIMSGVDIEFLDENGRRVGEKYFPESLAVTSSDIPDQHNAVTSSTSNTEILSSDGIDAFLNKNFPVNF